MRPSESNKWYLNPEIRSDFRRDYRVWHKCWLQCTRYFKLHRFTTPQNLHAYRDISMGPSWWKYQWTLYYVDSRHFMEVNFSRPGLVFVLISDAMMAYMSSNHSKKLLISLIGKFILALSTSGNHMTKSILIPFLIY